jgi:hypothetical protein
MAVGAQQDALRDLLSDVVDCPSHSALCNAERLLSRITVMKLERSETLVASAELASPTGLFDQYLLDLSAPTGNGLGSALLASRVPSFADQGELGLAMSATLPDDRSLSLADREFNVCPPSVARALQTMTLEPIPNRGLAAINGSGDFGKREPSLHKRLQVLPGQAPASWPSGRGRDQSWARAMRSVSAARRRCSSTGGSPPFACAAAIWSSTRAFSSSRKLSSIASALAGSRSERICTRVM